MVVSRSEQLLSHEILSSPQLFGGTTFISRTMEISTEPNWAMMIVLLGTPTGTTPSITWELDLNDNMTSWVRVGGALSAMTGPGELLVPYSANNTQGAIITSYNPTHLYQIRVVGTLANVDNVFPDVSADIVAFI
jgi:hypothetical protein